MFIFDLVFILFRITICWDRAVSLALCSCCFYFVLSRLCVFPFPLGVWGSMWNSMVSVPDLCLFIYFTCVSEEQISFSGYMLAPVFLYCFSHLFKGNMKRFDHF